MIISDQLHYMCGGTFHMELPFFRVKVLFSAEFVAISNFKPLKTGQSRQSIHRYPPPHGLTGSKSSTPRMCGKCSAFT